MRAKGSDRSYVLITAAYNEERFIDRTINSILAQTLLPLRWVIVSDGSTDRTDEIVQGYCARHDFIRLLRVDRAECRSVTRKVNALTVAYKEVQDVAYDFVGNLDADVSLGRDYFEILLKRFGLDKTLGIAGGFIYEESQGSFRSRLSNSARSVAHAAQMVRRECYEAMGGYVGLKYGGEDWCAEISARMCGWTVTAFPDLKVMHYRTTGAADRVLSHCFRQGKMDFSVGSYPAFEFFKCARRVPERPIGIGSLVRFIGFCWGYVRREPRLVRPEFVAFLRTEQKRRLKDFLNKDGTRATPSMSSSK
jgi:glycosyltransferase involved in cell wall biosynthesis